MESRNPGFSALIGVACLFLYGCSKTDFSKTPASQDPPVTTNSSHHVYGVLPPVESDYANVARYSEREFQKTISETSTTPSGSPYDSLVTPAIRNQGQIGSCTAFCGTEAYEILYYYRYGTWPTLLSPAYLYYIERVKLLHETIATDAGANMVNIPQALQNYGICWESLYAYPPNKTSVAYNTPPSAAAVSNALGYEIGHTINSYALVNSGDTAAVKNLLRNNIPVMMGFNVYENISTYKYFELLNASNYTYNPLTASGTIVSGLQLLGGHATPIIGYDDKRKAFIIQNSWGTAWGNHGFYLMPYAVFMNRTIVPQGNVYYATL